MKRFPTLYQVDTRDWLYRCSVEAGEPVTLDRIPDTQLDRLSARGFDLLWPLGIWQTGEAGANVSRCNPDWQESFCRALPNLMPAEITGSPYAITDYQVHRQFGGPEALQVLRERLSRRGSRLILDFVPNHVALDHEWTRTHPEFLMDGSAELLAREPANYVQIEAGGEARIYAYGRDPYFSGWPDTLQLDYSNPCLHEEMTQILERIASQCDGVRCDMAMLILPQVFQRTWGRAMKPFWPAAASRIKKNHPQFLLIAEAYWGLEWELQQQGFDYTYDKELYDRLAHRRANEVRGHLTAEWAYQNKSVRFLENHDEPRAATAFPGDVGRAAAAVSFFVPGLRLFHDGQLEGARIKPSVHLRRRAVEPTDPQIAAFYERVLRALEEEVFQGDWRILDCAAAWEGNPKASDFLCFSWSEDGRFAALVTVNFSDQQGQCYVRLPMLGSAGRLTFRDLLSEDVYVRDIAELAARGLYLDSAAWGSHIFLVEYQ